MIIYKVVNTKNKKIYIGQTLQPINTRWSDHKAAAKNIKNTRVFYHAIRKHGVENFSIEVLDSTATTLEELNNLEIAYIRILNTITPNGYNIEAGGNRAKIHPETAAKISATLKGRPILNRMNGAPKGRPVSVQRRAKISATMTGQPQPWNCEKILVVETGDIFDSVNQVSEMFEIPRTYISTLMSNGKTYKRRLTFKKVA